MSASAFPAAVFVSTCGAPRQPRRPPYPQDEKPRESAEACITPRAAVDTVAGRSSAQTSVPEAPMSQPASAFPSPAAIEMDRPTGTCTGDEAVSRDDIDETPQMLPAVSMGEARVMPLLERMKRNRSVNSELALMNSGFRMKHTGLSGGLEALGLGSISSEALQPSETLDARSIPCTRSKGQALVEAVLDRLVVGVHANHAGCGSMHDRNTVQRSSDLAFFGVFSGHGDAHTSQYCQEALYLNVLSSSVVLNDDASARRALLEGFRVTEKEVMELARGSQKRFSGSTAITLLLCKGGRCLTVAGLGDCKAVLCRAGRAVSLTTAHTGVVKSERLRAMREGATFEEDRLDGVHTVTRAIGCFESQTKEKPKGLSAIPELRSEPLRPEDEFVLLGTDGLWDVVSAEEAVSIARSAFSAYDDAQIVGEKLVETALARQTKRNVTAMAVRLFPPRHASGERSAPRSFVELDTVASFVRVVGGFDAS